MLNYYDIPAVSNSLLGVVKRELLGQPVLNQASQALRDGDAVHKLILEPHKFDFRKYSGRERMAFMKMQAGCMAVAGHMMEGQKEVEYFYEYMGLRCKMKADIVNEKELVITDLKTTRWSKHEEFIMSAMEYDYPRQAAWYLDAPPIRELKIETFRIIAICKADPYSTFVWELDANDPLIEAGREDYKAIISHLKINPKYSNLKSNEQSTQISNVA